MKIRINPIVALSAAMLLSGCANMGYVMSTYDGDDRTILTRDGKDWWVFDRPDLSKMMVNAPLSDAALAGATFGYADPQYSSFLQVGREFLASTGRNCVLDDGREVLRLQVEFNYGCQPQAASWTSAPATQGSLPVTPPPLAPRPDQAPSAPLTTLPPVPTQTQKLPGHRVAGYGCEGFNGRVLYAEGPEKLPKTCERMEQL